MMFYINEKRDPKTNRVRLVAWARVRDGEDVLWGGPRAEEWKRHLETWAPPRLNDNLDKRPSEREPFDINDPMDWAQLPSLDWGTYGWTRAESEDPRVTLG